MPPINFNVQNAPIRWLDNTANALPAPQNVDQIWAIVSKAFSYSAIGAVSGVSGSICLMGSAATTGLILAAFIYTVYAYSSFMDECAYLLQNGQFLPDQEKLERLKQLSSSLATAATILCGVALGVAGTGVWMAFNFLADRTVSGIIWSSIYGAVSIGLVLPYALTTFKTASAASFLQERAAHFRIPAPQLPNRQLGNDPELPNQRPVDNPDVALLDNLESVMGVPGLMTEEQIKALLLPPLCRLEGPILVQYAQKFKPICSWDYLAENLPEPKFRLIADAFLNQVPQHDLTAIRLQLFALRAKIESFEFRASKSAESVRVDVADGMTLFSRHAHSVNILMASIREVQDVSLNRFFQYRDIDRRLDTLRAKRHECRQLLNGILKQGSGSLHDRLSKLVEKTAVRDETSDPEEPAYEVLGAYFGEAKFKEIGETLGLRFGAKPPILVVHEYLMKQGLGTRRELGEAGILDVSDSNAVYQRLLNQLSVQ